LQRFHLEVPEDTYGGLAPVLGRLRAVPRTTEVHGTVRTVEGEIPAARVHELERRLPGLTRGEGLLECTFDRYAPVHGEAPGRPRRTTSSQW
jgi:ribosomal protection tetracycline resistance protein